MVSLSDVLSSNSRIATTLPPGLVAVFVGGTSGIGEYTLLQLVKHALKPRIYFVGRSQEAADRITAACKALNSEGEAVFIKADVSLIRNVDDVCRDIKSRERTINLLFITIGTLTFGTETTEGLQAATALIHYARARFIGNLLPLLQNATALRRVVSVFAGGKEGPIFSNDFQGWKIPVLSARGHGASLITLSLEALAKKAPDVSFVHDFPGPVRSNLARGRSSIEFFLRALFAVIGPFVYIPNEESGSRHLYLATSARYPAASGEGAGSIDGVPLTDGVQVARGTKGESGGGVYSVDEKCESAGPKVEELLAKLRQEGMVEQVWAHSEAEFKRITGA